MVQKPLKDRAEPVMRDTGVALPDIRPVGRLRPVPGKIAEKLGIEAQERSKVLVDDKRNLWHYRSEAAASKVLDKQKGMGAAVINVVKQPVLFAQDLGKGLADMGRGLAEHIAEEPLTVAGMGVASLAVAELIFNPPVAVAFGAVSAAMFTGQYAINRAKRNRQK